RPSRSRQSIKGELIMEVECYTQADLDAAIAVDNLPILCGDSHFDITRAEHVEARGSSQPHVVARGSSQPHIVAWGSSQLHIEASVLTQANVVECGWGQANRIDISAQRGTRDD